MVTFLFWNLDKKPLLNRVVRLARTHEVDVLMLAECAIDPSELLTAVNSAGGKPYTLPTSASEKIRIVIRFPRPSLVEEREDPIRGLTLRELKIDGLPYVLLAAIHLPSRINWKSEDYTLASTTIAQSIIRTEDALGHRRTILVGYLNMNPFDPGVVGAQGLNAVMTRQLARRAERLVRDKSYRIFYNPMWGFFGDRTDGPAGSYYYNAATPSNHFWNIFDQVLVRPGLMDALEEVCILDTDGTDALLTRNGLPRRSSGSDHLPLLFRLNLRPEAT